LGETEGRAEVPVPDYNLDPNNGGVSLSKDVRALRNHQLTDTNCQSFEDVEIRPLDAYGHTNVRLIKIDVEGMELPVIRGAHRTIVDSGFPPILFEMWNEAVFPAFAEQNEAVVRHFTELGYAVQRIAELGIAQYAGRRRMMFQVDTEKDILGSYWVEPTA
jgi:hypothetical protein